jgi:hypothetical protein
MVLTFSDFSLSVISFAIDSVQQNIPLEDTTNTSSNAPSTSDTNPNANPNTPGDGNVAGPSTMDVSLYITSGQLVGSVVGGALILSSGYTGLSSATRVSVVSQIVTNRIDGGNPQQPITISLSASNPPSPSTEATNFT